MKINHTLVADSRFTATLALKLALVLFAVPHVDTLWFVPFLENFVLSPSLDPWASYLRAGGDPLAFPYGLVMLLALLPGTMIALAFAAAVGLPLDQAANLGFGLNLLVLDYCALLLLMRLLPSEHKRVLLFYWLSPIAFYIIYWHGQVDIVPVLLLLASLLLLKNQRFLTSGAVLAAALSAKLSMALAAPLLLIYLHRNNRLRQFALPYLITLTAVFAVLQGPFLASDAFRKMVLGTPQAAKIFDVSLRIDGFELYILPLVYLLALYLAWRVRRINFGLLTALLGLSFFLVLLFTPASPGWFLWVVPFLVFHQVNSGPSAVILTSALSFFFVGIHLLNSTGAAIPVLELDFTRPFAEAIPFIGDRIQSIWITCLSAIGVVLVLNMAREGVQKNDYYRLSRRPLLLGIAGDSGAGKDTLAAALEGLFGNHSVAQLSGDDYHLWDRARPMWHAVTHLNPRANDLEMFSADALALADGRSVTVRHYDHAVGIYTKPLRIRHNDVVIVSGLHALYPANLRDKYDVRIYLDMDEDLRRALKMRRDVEQRGHERVHAEKAIESRAADADRFIRPQTEHADIILSLVPTRVDALKVRDLDQVSLTLQARLVHCLYLDDLLKALIGVCGLHVDYELSEVGGTSVTLAVTGEVDAEDIRLAAKFFLSHMDNLLDTEPDFSGGPKGVMQLIVLAHSAQALRERLQ